MRKIDYGIFYSILFNFFTFLGVLYGPVPIGRTENHLSKNHDSGHEETSGRFQVGQNKDGWVVVGSPDPGF